MTSLLKNPDCSIFPARYRALDTAASKTIQHNCGFSRENRVPAPGRDFHPESDPGQQIFEAALTAGPPKAVNSSLSVLQHDVAAADLNAVDGQCGAGPQPVKALTTRLKQCDCFGAGIDNGAGFRGERTGREIGSGFQRDGRRH